nr:MAG TPA: hypothetical protein [Caudoviricetes sp.]
MIWLGFSIIISSVIIYTGLYNLAEVLQKNKMKNIIEKRNK